MTETQKIHTLPFPHQILRRDFESFLSSRLEGAIVIIKGVFQHDFADFLVISDDFAQDGDPFERSNALSRLYTEFWSNAGYSGEKPLIYLIGMTKAEAAERHYI